jgi:hypothetical protein
MAKSTKSKWIIGLSGTALSAFVIGQIGGNPVTPSTNPVGTVTTESMSNEEKKVVQLDWSNFEINGAAVNQGAVQNDRQTRRS